MQDKLNSFHSVYECAHEQIKSAHSECVMTKCLFKKLATKFNSKPHEIFVVTSFLVDFAFVHANLLREKKTVFRTREMWIPQKIYNTI